jgi:hypothetical protein
MIEKPQKPKSQNADLANLPPAPIAAARGGANATNFVARRDFAATRFTQNLLLARFSQYCA